ncbi:unnamed protein product [Amoebophrya sp. A25]|nr:unnamed protein product [Amoebophrya sp. A25]|eukprot:GSA25T00022288001.1
MAAPRIPSQPSDIKTSTPIEHKIRNFKDCQVPVLQMFAS